MWLVAADARGGGTRDKSLRVSAWEVTAKVDFILNFWPSEIPDFEASNRRLPGSRFVITPNPASRP